MAERFIIDINVNGGTGQRATTSQPAQTDGRPSVGTLAAGAGLLTASSLDKKVENIYDKLRVDNSKFYDSGFVGINPDTIELKKRNFFTDTYRAEGFFSTPSETGRMSMSMFEAGEAGFNRVVETRVLGGKAGQFLAENQAKLGAGVIAAATKAVTVSIQQKNYRSGNSYANDQRNLAITAAQKSIGAAAAIGIGFKFGGPVGALVAVGGIAVNEAVNLYQENANFNFDRKMDKLYIHNMKEVLGDLSYGRAQRGR